MKKLILIFLVMLFLFSTVIAARLPIILPVAEQGCYSKYPNTEVVYSFKLDTTQPEGITNITETRRGVNKTVVYVHNFTDICLYSSTPESCYNCIRVGGVIQDQNQTINNTTTDNTNKHKSPLRVTLSIIIILLLMPKKKVKKNGNRRKN